MKIRCLLQCAALILTGLAGTACNEESQPQATQAVLAPCRCNQPLGQTPPSQLASSAPAPAALRPHRHLFSGWRWEHQHFGHRSEEVWEAGDYSSSASSSDQVYQEGDEHEVASRVSIWVDGYGRQHFLSAQSVDGGWQRADDDRARLNPWHGYDVVCPQLAN